MEKDPVGDINSKIINIGDFAIPKVLAYPITWGKSDKIVDIYPHRPCDGPGDGYIVKFQSGSWEFNFNIKLDPQLNLF